MKIKIGLAAPRIAASIEDGVVRVRKMLAEAAAQQVEIVCFPESYIPGLRGQDFEVPAHDQQAQAAALEEIRRAAAEHAVMTIIGMDWETGIGLHTVAFVISGEGEILGYQAKNQVALSEDEFFTPARGRHLFETPSGVKFGIVICHEGWRYPETVRWAAVRGAQIVFHPHHAGSDQQGPTLTNWGDPAAPYYEKAMMCRSIENTIFFASVNYAMKYQESATTIIDPEGGVLAYLPYGTEGILIAELDLSQATGLIANRYWRGLVI